jgi:3-oxoadipate enol-lactonase
MTEDLHGRGAPPRQSVVFLHGIGGGSRMWQPQQASFAAAGFRPIALDLPGYGERPAIDRMEFDALARDVEESLESLRLDLPILVGHSFGGMIVQTALRRRPAAYRAAVLSATSASFGDPTGDFQRAFVADRLRPLDAGRTMAELAEQMVDAMMGPGPDPAGRALAIAAMAATPERTYRAAVQCLIGFDERATLARIRIPVLCLAGQYDRNAPAAMMARMAAKIPGARYICLENVGHLANVEAPAMFDAAVLGFIRQVAADGAA